MSVSSDTRKTLAFLYGQCAVCLTISILEALSFVVGIIGTIQDIIVNQIIALLLILALHFSAYFAKTILLKITCSFKALNQQNENAV